MACPRCGFPDTTAGCENPDCENYLARSTVIRVGDVPIGEIKHWMPSEPVEGQVVEINMPSGPCLDGKKGSLPLKMPENPSRAVADFWMDGQDLHVVYADDHSHEVFKGIEVVSFEEAPGDPEIVTEREVKITVRELDDDDQ